MNYELWMSSDKGIEVIGIYHEKETALERYERLVEGDSENEYMVIVKWCKNY